MAPRNGLAPLGTINQNIQRTANSPYSKGGKNNLVMNPITTTPVSGSASQQQHADPFDDPAIVYGRNRKAEEFAKRYPQQAAAIINAQAAVPLPQPAATTANDYYQKLFADTNLDDLFNSRSQSRSSKPATVPMVVAPQRTVPLPASILVRKGKYESEGPYTVGSGIGRTRSQSNNSLNQSFLNSANSTQSTVCSNATTFNASFSLSQPLQGPMHPAARARQASRSVAIPDDQPAILLGRGTKTQTSAANIFTPKQQQRHPKANQPLVLPASVPNMYNSLHSNVAATTYTTPSHQKDGDALGYSNRVATGSCVKVGGAFVPATSVPQSREGSVASSRGTVAAANKPSRSSANQKRARSRSNISQRDIEAAQEEEAITITNSLNPSYTKYGHINIPSDGSSAFSSSLITGAFALPPDMRLPVASSSKRSLSGSQQTSDDALSSHLVHVGFTVRPLWSLVGTFKTGLSHLVDLRGGRSMRWVQRNPKGGHQQLIIPLHMIVHSGIVVVRVEATPTPKEAGEEERPRGRSRSNASSRASSASRSAGAATNTTSSSSFGLVQGNHTLPSYLRGKGGARSLTANSSTSSWAVIIRTVDMKPSQVTFGFKSAIEAQTFKMRVVELAKNLQSLL